MEPKDVRAALEFDIVFDQEICSPNEITPENTKIEISVVTEDGEVYHPNFPKEVYRRDKRNHKILHVEKFGLTEEKIPLFSAALQSIQKFTNFAFVRKESGKKNLQDLRPMRIQEISYVIDNHVHPLPDRYARDFDLIYKRRFEVGANKILAANLFEEHFLELVLEDKYVCRYVVNTLLGRDDLDIDHTYKRDICPSILAHDPRGRKYKIMLSRWHEYYVYSTKRNLAQMIYFCASSRDEIANTQHYFIWISEKDEMKTGVSISEATLQYTPDDQVIGSADHILYANAEVIPTRKSQERISNLLKFFRTCDPNDYSQGVLSDRVRYLKSEYGREEVSSYVRDLIRYSPRHELEWLDEATERRVFDIVWDTEDNGDHIPQEELGLPSEVTIPLEIDPDDIADYLSDQFGYCVASFYSSGVDPDVSDK